MVGVSLENEWVGIMSPRIQYPFYHILYILSFNSGNYFPISLLLLYSPSFVKLLDDHCISPSCASSAWCPLRHWGTWIMALLNGYLSLLLNNWKGWSFSFQLTFNLICDDLDTLELQIWKNVDIYFMIEEINDLFFLGMGKINYCSIFICFGFFLLLVFDSHFSRMRVAWCWH